MVYNIVSLVFTLNMLRISTSATSVRASMEEQQVVPDVIPKAPALILKVSYPSQVEVTLGNKLALDQVKDEPLLKWLARTEAFYTLCMIDPDTPSREHPILRHWQNWLVGNIPGNEIAKGETLSEYASPVVSSFTGVHRFVFLVYEQPGKLIFDERRCGRGVLQGRANFKLDKFVEKYNLSNPVAGNFFTTQQEYYGPELHEMYN